LLLRSYRQLPWLIVFVAGSATALGLRWWCGRGMVERLTGGSRAGLAFGIAGWLLMLFALLLIVLRWLPRWWFIGSRAAWLRGHVWLGSLCGVLVLCHTGGLHWGGPFEQLLCAAFALTLLTGLGGLALQQFLPRLLTSQTACEVPYEQIPVVCAKMASSAAREMKKLQQDKKLPAETLKQLDALHDERVHPFLLGTAPGRSPLADRARSGEVFAQVRTLPGVSTAAGNSPAEALLGQFEMSCEERRLLVEQERLQFWLHSWLYLHVPLSAALTILSVAHVTQMLCF
jgi:hypothetical protein